MDDIEAGSFVVGTPRSEWPATLRIVSWNVNRGLQLDGIIEFLASMTADVILLQETDIRARRTGYRNIPRDIARALQMHYVFGREFEELGQGNTIAPAYHGQATLSRLPLMRARILRFRQQSRFWEPRWFIPRLEPLQRRIGGRMALLCEVTIHNQNLVLYNLHLESRGNDELRLSQLSQVLAEITRSSAPAQVVLAGDFNFDTSNGSAAALLAGMRIVNPFANFGVRPTVRNGHHAKCRAIDCIVTGKALRTGHPEIHDSISASDHFPLSLEIHLTGHQDGAANA